MSAISEGIMSSQSIACSNMFKTNNISEGSMFSRVVEKKGNQRHHGFKIFHFLHFLIVKHIVITQTWLLINIESKIASSVQLPQSLELLEFAS